MRAVGAAVTQLTGPGQWALPRKACRALSLVQGALRDWAPRRTHCSREGQARVSLPGLLCKCRVEIKEHSLKFSGLKGHSRAVSECFGQ